MSLRIAVVLLLLLGTAFAQDSVPISLTGKNAAPVCRGKGKDAPGCITPPRAIYAPDPEYPTRARKENVRGFVVLQIVVGADGLPRDKVARSNPELDEAATDAVKKWRFSPATKGGEPVAVQINVELHFHLFD
jgi:protein TonB